LRGQKIRCNGRNHAKGETAANGVFLFVDVAPGGFEFAKDGASAREKGFAEIGEADGASETIEEACAKFVLELANLLGERRLRDVGLFGAAAETAGFDDGTEITELVEFHGFSDIKYRISVLQKGPSVRDLATIPPLRSAKSAALRSG
jgi:hypothetical protein